MNTARLVTCPTCQRKVPWSETSPFRPFCSERCRLIDLGAWVSEQRGIPGDEPLADGLSGDEDPTRVPGLPSGDDRDHRH